MEHKQRNFGAKVLFIVFSLLVYTRSYAMENSQSPPTTKHLGKLLKLQKNDCKDSSHCHDIHMHADILDMILSHNKNLATFLKQEKYRDHIRPELFYWITMTCANKDHTSAALLYIHCGTSNPELQDHAFSKALEYDILLDFACSLEKYQRKQKNNKKE